jgi:hypothetical protein
VAYAGPDPHECPLCHRSDWTQPVDAIVTGQTTHTTRGGSSFGVALGPQGPLPVSMSHTSYSRQQTPLAAMLDLPSPLRTKGWGCFLPVIWGVLILFSFPALTWAFTEGPSWAPSITVLTFVSLGGILTIAVVLGYNRAIRRWRQRRRLWERAIHVWISLCYCHRDGVVFQWPDTYFAPQDTKRFSYEEAQRRWGNAT